MFGGPQKGYWSLKSKKDPRWNDSGCSDCITMMGMCPEASHSIERTEKILKEKPPKDLTYSCMKD
jgi:hypothetical protein